MRHFTAVTILIMIGVTLRGQESNGDFLTRSITVEGESYSYQVFRPRDWSPKKKWPVVLFLHGAGERGSDGVAHTQVGLPRFLSRNSNWQAVVVLPQCPRRAWWGDPAVEKLVFASLDDAIAAFNGDPSRIYLTGLSLGGYGTWAFGYKYPQRFAALAPVCGGVAGRSRIPPPDWHPASHSPDDPYRETARGIGATPVWAFHGSDDGVIPVTESRRLVKALREVGGNVRYTEYEGVGHNSWDAAYAEPELVTWLLAQKRE